MLAPQSILSIRRGGEASRGCYHGPVNTPREKLWFETAFGRDYLRLYAHRSPEQGRAQVTAMLAAGLIPRAGRVLDLCCGAGRHLRPLREAGLAAFGLDLSLPLLRQGGLEGLAVLADARAIPFADGAFDAIVNLFTSFGYFDNDGEHLRMLREVARVLRPGGTLVMDHLNAEVAVRELVPRSVEEREGMKVTQQRRYDAGARRIHKNIELHSAGETRRWHESVRVFTPAELDGLLETAGLAVQDRHGDLGGAPFDPASSPRQVVLALPARRKSREAL
jgi:SAM-dependent methyltransferase